MKHSELRASTLYKAWLQYDNVEHLAASAEYKRLLRQIFINGRMSGVLATAVAELQQGIKSMLGLEPIVAAKKPLAGAYLSIGIAERDDRGRCKLRREAFTLRYESHEDEPQIVLTGGSEFGVLYGVFYLLRSISSGADPLQMDVAEFPRNELRMINQWDNADGSIERGYAGNSIFYENGKITVGSGEAERLRQASGLGRHQCDFDQQCQCP